MNDVRKRDAFKRADNDMNMVWHNAQCIQAVPLLMKILSCILYEPGDRMLAKKAVAHASVEIAFNLFRVQFCKSLMLIICERPIQLLGGLHDIGTFEPICIRNFSRDRIVQSKGNKISGPAQFPMRQMSSMANA